MITAAWAANPIPKATPLRKSRVARLCSDRVSRLKIETYALYLACKDRRVPWYAKAFTACVVGYAFSPIDLIPDFIPVLGYLDDLVLIPVGIMLAVKMIPPAVLDECRQKATETFSSERPTNWLAAGIIVAVWVLLIALVAVVFLRTLNW
jgi:uncharacterized membrane protein YkvA (DUF1232 family)